MKAVSTDNDSEERELDNGTKVKRIINGIGAKRRLFQAYLSPPPLSSCSHLLSLDVRFSQRCSSLAGDVWDRGWRGLAPSMSARLRSCTGTFDARMSYYGPENLAGNRHLVSR